MTPILKTLYHLECSLTLTAKIMGSLIVILSIVEIKKHKVNRLLCALTSCFIYLLT